jgi:adenosylmethionine-8-amino-7-oxononanoate aminotransferase
MWVVEIVADRDTRRPYPRTEQVTERLYHRLYEDGVLLYKSTGLAGLDGDAIVVGPPFVATDDELEQIVQALVRAVAAELGS